MANNGTIITPPVGFRDVQQVISESYDDLGLLCRSAKINKWAKFKPVKANVMRQLTYEELSNAKFGLTPIVNATLYGKSDASDTTTSPVSSTSELEDVLNSNQQWTYTPPSGGMAAPYRLTDFAPTSDKMTLSYGYHHQTPPPIEGVTSKVFDLSHINNCANNTTITSAAGESAYDWELNDPNNTSPLFSGLAFRFGDASGDVVNNASTYAIALSEILGISNGENWRLAVAVQVPTISGQLSYMRVFTSKMTFEAVHTLTTGKAQAIMPSLGTNQYLCKLIKDYADYLYGMTAQEDVIGNKKLSLDTQTFSFVLPAMLCVVKDIGMSGVSRQGSSTPYTHALLTQGSTLYSAPALLTRFELTVNDNVHFTADQIKAYSLLLIKTEGTGQYAEFVPGQSSSRVYINNLVLQQMDTVTQDTTIYYSVELTVVTGWSGGKAQTQIMTRSGSVMLTPGTTMQEWTIYAAPGLSIRNKTQSLNPI